MDRVSIVAGKRALTFPGSSRRIQSGIRSFEVREKARGCSQSTSILSCMSLPIINLVCSLR